MSDHIPDLTKMIGETPRTDAKRSGDKHFMGDWVNADFARQLERELNAANERIKRLEEALKDLLIAVTFADPPKEFNGVLCNEALVPIGFVDSARVALESKEAKP